MNRTLFLSIFSFGGLFCAAQQPPEVPRQDFSAPMAHKRVLAGTFGELRDGHFHSGDDFKTQFIVGKEILAPADGSVVRVSVSHGGYGKALYLRHPNGYTTVYGHLNGFAPKIDSVVHARQYAKRSYAVNIEIPEGEIPVEKGELVAWSGNTGGSMGPHLHFEVRRTRDNLAMNPLLFGFSVDDHRAPTLNGLYLMNLEGSDSLETRSEPRRIVFEKGREHARVKASGRVAFLVDAYDTMDDAPNHNGVYGIDLYVDGQKAYGMRMDGFYFEHTGLIDRHIAYDYYIRNGVRLVKCYVEPFNRLTLYAHSGDDPRQPARSAHRDPGPGRERYPPLGNGHGQHLSAGIPAAPYGHPDGPFLSGVSRRAAVQPDPVRTVSRRLPRRDFLQEPVFRLRTHRLDDLPPAQPLGPPAKTLHRTVRHPPPPASPSIEKGSWRSGEKLPGRYLRMYIRDGQTGIASFDAYVDGRWVLMEYEYKRRELTLDTQRENIAPGRHTLRLEVTDGVGNRSVFEDVFVR